MYYVGIDVGSTTAKIVVTNPGGEIVFKKYLRHGARISEILQKFLSELRDSLGDVRVSVCLTGSIGMGVAEKCGFNFVQEVVAATKSIRRHYPQVSTMIDIGGEDAKVVFFDSSCATDLRMNGNCAGGTGAFIDQMAIILDVSVDELAELALKSERIYPVASRCGVFCKTDIQNLIAKNVSKEDIAASIFHAVTIQTVVTLAHGRTIAAPVLFCGGPLTFIPALRNSFIDYLSLKSEDVVLPEDGSLITAYGTALMAEENATTQMSSQDSELMANSVDKSISEIISKIKAGYDTPAPKPLNTEYTMAEGSAAPARSPYSELGRRGTNAILPPVFKDAQDYAAWKTRISAKSLVTAQLESGEQDVFLGIDSGSTTTKIVVLNSEGKMVYSWYSPNGGNPVNAVKEGLNGLIVKCEEAGAQLNVAGSCSTGYGEDLIKAAFGMDFGIVETMAHYRAAYSLDKDVSFILDIGGQDMKAIFVNDGVIDRIEINEACSSGCGSFIETFAKSLGFTASEFAEAACNSSFPCDLGTRCTVFMNSKVKQVLREGASMEDIAAGLSYSVIKNCLYKVLKLNNTAVLGKHIVVQGGTMRNNAVVRALENLTGCEVSRCDAPELMGAVGCALFAMERYAKNAGEHSNSKGIQEMMSKAEYQTASLNCRGCENSCLVVRYRFDNGGTYYSGNRCERVFSSSGEHREKGENVYHKKVSLLFDRAQTVAPSPAKAKGKKPLTIGIPRCLNMFEEFPFWHKMFTECGINVVLSDPSALHEYERVACMVMSDNICFPAKLAHSHIRNLQQKGVDRIFMPFVIYEREGKEQNTYNCPIVAGYSEVIRSVQSNDIPLDTPVITFKDKELTLRQCVSLLKGYGVNKKTAIRAIALAEEELDKYEGAVAEASKDILHKYEEQSRLTVLLLGRPYHSDPLIQHKVSDIIAGMGVNVISDDIVRDMDIPLNDVHFVSQWAYTNRILKAAKWGAMQDDNVQCVQLTSFGCGPDAFLTDAVRDLVMNYGKSLTLLKLDDIDNVGSLKLRIRSLVESLKLSRNKTRKIYEFKTVPVFEVKDRRRTILAPYFTPFISPVIPPVMKLAGYNVVNLPMSDAESCEMGLKYANNEVCYPATLVVGDIVKALNTGKYDLNETAVAITQTGGQCRASNYISLIKKALVDAGYGQVPVIAVSIGSGIDNYQPGFTVDWGKMIKPALYAILVSDTIAKFYYPSAVREKIKGKAMELKNKYLDLAGKIIEANKDLASNILALVRRAADEFNSICIDKDTAKVGVVGEIYLKFNPFAHKDVTSWLMDRGIEIAPPILLDFFIQYFVNRKVKKQTGMERSSTPEFLFSALYKYLMSKVAEVNKAARKFRYFHPFGDIFEEAEYAKEMLTLNSRFGEGWLLPGEIAGYCLRGVNNVISLQPFGCIANHIVEKGIENKIKKLYPQINLLSLDFDSGVSDVNVINRMLLFFDNIKQPDRVERREVVLEAD